MVQTADLLTVKWLHPAPERHPVNLALHEVAALLAEHNSTDRNRDGKLVLFQAIEPDHCQSLIEIAWQNGWIVGTIKEDMRHKAMPDFSQTIGTTLLISSAHRSYSPVSVNAPVAALPARHTWPEDECAAILFTSGSTGLPKGVCHSRGNMLRSAELFVRHCNLREHDHLLCLAPIHTASGFRALLMPRFTDARITLYQPAGETFLKIINNIARSKPTAILCGPVFIHQVASYGMRLRESLRSVKILFSAGAALLQQDRDTIEACLPIKVWNIYGQTETAGIALADSAEYRSTSNLPHPCSGVRVSLEPNDAVSGTFRLHIASPNLYLGYLGEPLCRRALHDTGDLVVPTASGDLSLIGRASNTFKAPSTEWLFPELLENWLKEQDYAEDAYVRGIPVHGGHGCEVWLDACRPYSRRDIEAEIAARFGGDYKPVHWHDCRIVRTELGKISQFLKKDLPLPTK